MAVHLRSRVDMEQDADLIQTHHLYDLKYRLGDVRGSSVAGATLLRLSASSTLITAPHSVTHMRAKREKAAEFWTGAIAETLSSVLGVNALTALSPRREAKNAASLDHFLRVVLLMLQTQHISLVLDVHGLAARHALDINIGSAGFCKPQLVKDLAKDLAQVFSVALGKPYNGENSITGMVNRAATIDASAIQLECGPRLRSDTTSAGDLRTLAAALGRFEEAFLRVR